MDDSDLLTLTLTAEYVQYEKVSPGNLHLLHRLVFHHQCQTTACMYQSAYRAFMWAAPSAWNKYEKHPLVNLNQ